MSDFGWGNDLKYLTSFHLSINQLKKKGGILGEKNDVFGFFISESTRTGLLWELVGSDGASDDLFLKSPVLFHSAGGNSTRGASSCQGTSRDRDGEVRHASGWQASPLTCHHPAHRWLCVVVL